ncbi:MAG: glycosyltransferase family 4 protein [Candidatus Micrarchaeota archaeon]|nr:glycosyltransferase family 4 protein [Candidatus Micrarchaeota archaeon]
MRIAFVSDAAYPWNVGGLESAEFNEAEALARHHEVHFFSMRWPGMGSDFTYKRIRYHATKHVTKEKFYRHGRRSIREAIIFSVGMLRIFAHRFDVIEANMFPILHIPLLKLYCKLTGCKLILDVVEVWSKEYWTRYLGAFWGTLAHLYSNYFLSSADLYIANSSITADRIHAAGIGRHRIRVFAPVIDDRLMARIRSKARARKRQVIFSGRLIKEKRLDKWLQVFGRVREQVPDATGLIIGEGPEHLKLMAMINELGLSDSVRIRPFYPEGNVGAMYREIASSAVLLNTSEREGLSIISLEALALGVPVALPSYTPIPKEVRRMCTVSAESQLPSTVAKMLRGGRRAIPNSTNLSSFYISRAERFYDGCFEALGIGKG